MGYSCPAGIKSKVLNMTCWTFITRLSLYLLYSLIPRQEIPIMLSSQITMNLKMLFPSSGMLSLLMYPICLACLINSRKTAEARTKYKRKTIRRQVGRQEIEKIIQHLILRVRWNVIGRIIAKVASSVLYFNTEFTMAAVVRMVSGSGET